MKRYPRQPAKAPPEADSRDERTHERGGPHLRHLVPLVGWVLVRAVVGRDGAVKVWEPVDSGPSAFDSAHDCEEQREDLKGFATRCVPAESVYPPATAAPPKKR
jgi:hypothetical protein